MVQRAVGNLGAPRDRIHSSALKSLVGPRWSYPDLQRERPNAGDRFGSSYGEQVTTTVDHGSNSPYDCLSWAAIIFSTTVQDTDEDGLPDKLELTQTVIEGAERRPCRISAPWKRRPVAAVPAHPSRISSLKSGS